MKKKELILIKISRFLFPATVFGCIFFINAAISFKYFPITEGWWETYYWLNESGLKLYEDVQLSHPPFHLMIYGWLLDVFNDRFFSLRLLGCFISGAIALLQYFWLRNVLTAKGALVGTLIATTSVVIFNSAYIVRDYHSTVVFFEIITIALSVFVFKNPSNKKLGLTLSFLMGVSGALLALTKQNLGVFFNAGVIAGYATIALWYRYQGQRQFIILLSGAAFIVGLLASLATAVSIFGAEWLSVYINPGKMKGDVVYVLTRFARDKTLLSVPMVSVQTIVAIFLQKKYGDTLFEGLSRSLNLQSVRFQKNGLGFLLALCLFFINLKLLNFGLYNIFFGAVLGIVAFVFFDKFKKGNDSPDWIIGGFPMFLSLAYAGTNTAGYNFVSMDLLIAYAMTFIFIQCVSVSLSEYKLVGLAILYTFIVTAFKFTGPLYNWWGLVQGSGFSANYALSNPMFDGLSVDSQTKDMFDVIDDVKANLSPSSTIFAYPNIPIVYKILNKLPTTRFPNLWFDVSESSAASEIITSLKNTPPDVVIWLKPPPYVYSGHIELTRQNPLMSEIDDFLLGQVKSRKYVVDSQMLLSDQNWRNNIRGLESNVTVKLYATPEQLESARHCFVDIKPIDYMDLEAGVHGYLVTYSNPYTLLECANKNNGFVYSNERYYNFIVLKRVGGS